ncbi:MAG: diacylglyceryl transferase, partial [Candidatus Thermoplasmatota archaeon]|nr:diacylglyceryl transferase [Candidatus Thermoplasmatota archaeon]
MQFPVWIDLGSAAIHPHFVFEVLGYLIGISLTIWISSSGRDTVSPKQRHPLILAGLVGALIGAKILAWAQHPQTTILAVTEEPVLLFGGKTIVGGLLGGMAGIELAKKALGIEQ